MTGVDLVRDRIELKYRLSAAAAEAFVAGLPSGLARRTSWITTVYLDTPDRRLTRAARRDPRACLKLRLREYADSPLVWVELKERRGERSLKERFPVERERVSDVLGGEHPRIRALARDGVVPVGTVRCRRISVESEVRLTVDRDIRYQAPGAAERIEEGAVLELKRTDVRVPDWCLDALRGLEPEEYSKFARLAGAPVA